MSPGRRILSNATSPQHPRHPPQASARFHTGPMRHPVTEPSDDGHVEAADGHRVIEEDRGDADVTDRVLVEATAAASQ